MTTKRWKITLELEFNLWYRIGIEGITHRIKNLLHKEVEVRIISIQELI